MTIRGNRDSVRPTIETVTVPAQGAGDITVPVPRDASLLGWFTPDGAGENFQLLFAPSAIVQTQVAVGDGRFETLTPVRGNAGAGSLDAVDATVTISNLTVAAPARLVRLFWV